MTDDLLKESESGKIAFLRRTLAKLLVAKNFAHKLPENRAMPAIILPDVRQHVLQTKTAINCEAEVTCLIRIKDSKAEELRKMQRSVSRTTKNQWHTLLGKSRSQIRNFWNIGNMYKALVQPQTWWHPQFLQHWGRTSSCSTGFSTGSSSTTWWLGWRQPCWRAGPCHVSQVYLGSTSLWSLQAF